MIRLLIGIAFALAPLAGAAAEERGTWFQSLKQPGSGISCCDVADCHQTSADWRDGQWWAIVRSKWTAIPRDRVLGKKSIDGEAYVCNSESGSLPTIYCFVPPNMGF
jgi:hypothetical protein